MENINFTVGIFEDHGTVARAVQKLLALGFSISSLSVIGKAFHAGEIAVGLHTMRGSMAVWGERGKFWSGLWETFSGGVMLSIAILGPVVVLGQFATVLVTIVEEAQLIGKLSPLGSTLFAIGIPLDNIPQYERVLMADGLLVLVSGTQFQMADANQAFSDVGVVSSSVFGVRSSGAQLTALSGES